MSLHFILKENKGRNYMWFYEKKDTYIINIGKNNNKEIITKCINKNDIQKLYFSLINSKEYYMYYLNSTNNLSD